jgi:hypothetical protein
MHPSTPALVAIFVVPALLAPAGRAGAGGPPFVCPHCPSVNGDDTVDVVDLVEVVTSWGPCQGSCPADVSGDGVVAVTDLVEVILHWGVCDPPNDDCGTPTDLELDQFGDCISVFIAEPAFCTIGASTDGPSHAACSFGSYNQVGADVWFRVTAVHTGPLTVTTCLNQGADNANFNTKIAVYGQNALGNCNCPSGLFPAALLGCNDNDPLHGDVCSTVEIAAEAGECYRIRVGGYFAATGAGILTLDNRPWGEFCTHPIELDQFVLVNVTGSTTDNDSICDNGDDSSCAFNDTIDEWYLYQPFCDATVTVTTCHPGTNYDTTLAVYQGFEPPLVCPANLPAAQVACNDDFNGAGCQLPNGLFRKSRVSFLVTAGDDPYLIRVSGYNGASGAYQMSVITDCIGGN